MPRISLAKRLWIKANEWFVFFVLFLLWFREFFLARDKLRSFWNQGVQLIGKMNPEHKACYLPYKNKELNVFRFYNSALTIVILCTYWKVFNLRLPDFLRYMLNIKHVFFLFQKMCFIFSYDLLVISIPPEDQATTPRWF